MRGWVTIEKNSVTQGHAMAQAALPVASVVMAAEAGIAKPKGLGLRLPASELWAQAPAPHQDQPFASARLSAAAHTSTASLASLITRPMVMKPWIWRSKLISVALLPASLRRCA